MRKALIDALPQSDGPPAAYAKQVCLDLLESKQGALDRGVPFPVGKEVICERCRSVFETLDWAHDLCGQITHDMLPDHLHKRLRAALKGD